MGEEEGRVRVGRDLRDGDGFWFEMEECQLELVLVGA